MKRLALILVAASTIAGASPRSHVIVERNSYCAATEHNLNFTAAPRFDEVRVRWVPTEEVSTICPSGHNAKACAVVEQKADHVLCTVYTQKWLNLAVLGHEVRHCFELGWHR